MQIMNMPSSYRFCPSFHGAIRHNSSTGSFTFTKAMDVSPKAWQQTLVPYCKKLYQLLPEGEQQTFRQLHGAPPPMDVSVEKIAQFAQALLSFAAGPFPERHASNDSFWGIIAPVDLEKFAGTGTMTHPTLLEFRIKSLRTIMQKFPPGDLSLIQLGEIATDGFFSLFSNLNKEGLQFQSVIGVEESEGAMLHAKAYNRLYARIPNLTLCADQPVSFLENNQKALKEKKIIFIGTENALRIRFPESSDERLERLFGVLSKIIQKDMPIIFDYLTAPSKE